MKKPKYQPIPGSVTAPKGFYAGAVFCDIKRLGTGKGSNKGRKSDLALIVSQVPAAVAGMFTTNQVMAAPVRVSIGRAHQAQAQAVVVNSGNANACTGSRGLRDAERMAVLAAQALNSPQCPVTGLTPVRPGRILVASTGRIGLPLPMRNVARGISAVAAQLGTTEAHAQAAAEAILTSDTRRKEIALEFRLGRVPVRLGGMCKGAGMIEPGMSPSGRRPWSTPLHATMLCFLTTDAAVESAWLKIALREAVARSFNRISVDGDMSTNDTVLLLANGLAGNPRIEAEGSGGRRISGGQSRAAGGRAQTAMRATFQEALDHATLELAKMIVRDGEGVSRFVTVRVEGARSPAEADLAARAVANSLLVKTSWFGGDPNWGRILDALGYSAATVAEQRVDVAYRREPGAKLIYSLRRGQPTRTPFSALCAVVAGKTFELHIDLNLGGGRAVHYTSDLTMEYVDFNKGDVTDPASLGG